MAEEKEYLIKDSQVETIVTWLDETNLPHKQVMSVIKLLEDLPELNETEE